MIQCRWVLSLPLLACMLNYWLISCFHTPCCFHEKSTCNLFVLIVFCSCFFRPLARNVTVKNKSVAVYHNEVNEFCFARLSSFSSQSSFGFYSFSSMSHIPAASTGARYGVSWHKTHIFHHSASCVKGPRYSYAIVITRYWTLSPSFVSVTRADNPLRNHTAFNGFHKMFIFCRRSSCEHFRLRLRYVRIVNEESTKVKTARKAHRPVDLAEKKCSTTCYTV